MNLRPLHAALLALAACAGDTHAPGVPAPFGDAPPLLDAAGQIVLVRQVRSEETWKLISGAIWENESYGTRFLIPVPGKTKLTPYFMNINNHPEHNALLRDYFKDEFAGLTYNEYVTYAIDPARRKFFAGNITQRADAAGRRVFTFTVWHHVSDPKKTLTREQVSYVHATLASLFTIGELEFDPFSRNQREAMKGWDPAPFRVYRQDELLGGYEGYTLTAAYGRLTFVKVAGFENGVIDRGVGYQDIVVADIAPFDVVPVVSGIVTGTRQGELSHLNVRFANRHIANCFLADPAKTLKAYEGKLVRLEAKKDGWTIREASLADAERWWASLKPAPVVLSAPDRDHRELADVTAVPTGSAAERALAFRRFGAKAAQLAVLYRLVDKRCRLRALAVPAAWYFDFMDRNGWRTTLNGRAGFHSFRETITAWLAGERFRTDPAYRSRNLALFRKALVQADLDPALLARLREKVREVFGADTVMLRLRSSSNAEDSAAFSGAGLYDSKTACVADDFDGDERGPSRGDPMEAKEKTAARALKEVWASLWNDRAVEERIWYSIDQTAAAMAVLVNERTRDEKTNLVVFTGDPGSRDDRFLFNAQPGEVDTVKTYGGVYPEKAWVTVADGRAAKIERVSFSNIAAYDLYLLSPEHIEEITSVLWAAANAFPADFTVPAGRTLLWDTEWKITKDNRVVIKQIRPFLRDDGTLTERR